MAFRDIRKSRKWLSAEEIRVLALGLFVLALMLAANVSLARTLPSGEWLFQRWAGARSFLLEVIQSTGGVKGGRVMPEGTPDLIGSVTGPYTTEIAQRTQELVYGRRAFSSEYTYVLNDPFFILLLYTPLAFISDFTLARGIWMVVSELALIGIVLLAFNLSAWYRGQNLTLGYIVSTWFPNLPFPAGPVVSLGLAILLFLEWWDSVDAHFRRVVWTASLSLAATPLMGFPIFPSNYVVLILPFVLILALVWERWQRYRILRVGLLFLLVLLIPFGLYYRVVTVYDPLVIDLIAVLPPIAAILGLYWMRWWVLRSPRTLFDRTGD